MMMRGRDDKIEVASIVCSVVKVGKVCREFISYIILQYSQFIAMLCNAFLCYATLFYFYLY